MADLVNRLAWYLANADVTVSMPLEQGMNAPGRSAVLPIPRGQRATYSQLPSQVQFVKPVPRAFSQHDAILVWDWRHLGNVAPYWDRVSVVDPLYYSTAESVSWASLYFETLDARRRSELRERSLANYSAFQATIAGAERSYVFTTGPSIDSASTFTYEAEALKIVCNSMVRNSRLLAHIRPQLIVFADPVFHFSPCAYSAEFRRHAVRAILDCNAFCVVPEQQAGLLIAHYPELRDRVVGMPLDLRPGWHWPSASAFRATITENIMTLLMLPLAAANTREICVLGADGRQSSESYFWRHSTQNQFDDLMQTAFDTHSSFFRDRVYTDYYDKHCRVVASQVEAVEASGGKVVALTPSFIPALSERFVARVASSPW